MVAARVGCTLATVRACSADGRSVADASTAAASLSRSFDSEPDTNRAALQRLRRMAERYHEQFVFLLRDPGECEGLVDSVRSLQVALEAEVHELQASSPDSSGSVRPPSPAPHGRNFDILRISLQEAQRRVETLTSDLAQQAGSNDELAQSLATVEDTKKRYLEQMRVQEEELAQLAQRSSADEERMDGLLRTQCEARDSFDQDRRRRILAAREAADSRHGEMERCLTEQLHQSRNGLEALKRELRNVRQVLVSDVEEVSRTMQRQMEGAQAEARAGLAAYSAREREKRTAAESVFFDLKSQVEAADDLRCQEDATRAQLHATLMSERIAIQSRDAREGVQATSQLRAIDRTLAAERASNDDARFRFEEQCEDCIGQSTEQNNAAEATLLEVSRAQNLLVATESDVHVKELSLSELRRCMRESDDSLAATVSSNEHIREQMEEHQRRVHDMSASDVDALQKLHERKVSQVRELHDAEVSSVCQQLQSAQTAIDRQTYEVSQLQSELDALDAETKTVKHDLDSRQMMFEHHTSARQELENTLASARKDFAQEQLRLKSAIDQLAPLRMQIEEEMRSNTEEFAQRRRKASALEMERVGRVNVMENRLRHSQLQLADSQQRLTETEALFDRANADVDAAQQRAAKAQAELERELEQRARQFREEERDLECQLEMERLAARKSCDEAEQLHESHATSMRQAKDESSAQLAALEREQTEAEDAYHHDMAQAQQLLQQQDQQREAVEHDLSRVAQLLAESQDNLQWVLRERERHEGDLALARRRLEDEARHTTGALEAVASSTVLCHEQLRAAEDGHGRSRQQLASDISDLKRRIGAQRGEAEARSAQQQQEHRAALDTADRRHREAVFQRRERMEQLARENEGYRNALMSDARASSGTRLCAPDIYLQRRESFHQAMQRSSFATSLPMIAQA